MPLTVFKLSGSSNQLDITPKSLMTKGSIATTFQRWVCLLNNCSRHHHSCQTRRHLLMTPPAAATAFSLTGGVLVSARCNCTCDLGPKERRPRSSAQLSQRDIATRSDTGAPAITRKQYQRHKPNHPIQHDKPTSRTRRLTDTKSSRPRRRIRHPPICLALIPDISMDTPTSSSRPRGTPQTLSSPTVVRATSHHPLAQVRDSRLREQMESLAARLGSVVLQQIGHLMEVMGQTQGMSTCSTRDRSHGRAAGRPYCRKDETEAPSEPSQIAKEAATRALSRYKRIDALLEANPDPDNCCIVTSNILLSPHAPAPLGGVCADPPHEDILKSWLWLMLPLGIWKGALHLNVAAVSLFLLLHRIIGGRQPRVHGPSVNQTTWLEKGENNKPQVSHGSESRIVGETASKPGESSTGGKRAAKKQSQRGDGGHDEDDDDDDGGDRPRHPKRMRSEARDERFFACPFLKHNPRKYQSCMGRMWPTVHRVKFVFHLLI